MRDNLLAVILAGAVAGCGGSGTRSTSSTGGTGGATADMATLRGRDGGAPVADGSAPVADAGTGAPVADAGAGDASTGVPVADGGATPRDAGDGSVNDGGAGAPCPATPVTIGMSARPGAVAADSRYVYWMDDARPQTIWRVAPSGGPAERVATDSYSTIDDPSNGFRFYLVADDNGVYWGSTAYPGGQSAGVSHIFALRPSGTVDTLADGALVEDLVLFDSTLYFMDRYGSYAVPTIGGGKQTIYSSFSDDDRGSLIADAAHLFVQQNGTITRVDRTGGDSVVLGNFAGVALTVDVDRAYALAAGVVDAFPPASGLQLSPSNPSGVGGSFLLRDGTNLYYGGPNGDLSRLGSDGSGYTELAPAATAAVIFGDRIVYSHDSAISVVCK